MGQWFFSANVIEKWRLIERARDVCVQVTFASEGVDVDNNDDDGGGGDGGSGTRLARYKWITLARSLAC